MKTAETAGKTIPELGLALFGKLKGYWLLATCVIGALFWAYDLWQAHAPLPERAEAQAQRIAEVERRLDWLEATDAAGTIHACRTEALAVLLTSQRVCGPDDAEAGRRVRAPVR
ncbi:MAG: hypothetical protein AAF074_24715 [Pseudomonadota bacterium]